MKTLILKDHIMSMDGKYVWVAAGSKFTYFPKTDECEAHYASGTCIIYEKNIDLNKFVQLNNE